jgi:hypothetical protein
VAFESEEQQRVREHVFPRLAWAPSRPPGAGVYAVTLDEVAEVHEKLLFPGGVEACDGTSHVHDSLALTIHQVGVSLVSYGGDQGTWCQRLFRRDLKQRQADPVAEVLDLLERRDRRGGLNHPTAGDPLSELAQRALMSYAERAVLLHKSRAAWRLGHGNPPPLELFIAAGLPDLMIESVKVIRDLVAGHRKFVFVASEPRARMLLTIGHALRPLEYAVVGRLDELLERPFGELRFRGPVTVDAAWDGAVLTPEKWVQRFHGEVALPGGRRGLPGDATGTGPGVLRPRRPRRRRRHGRPGRQRPAGAARLPAAHRPGRPGVPVGLRRRQPAGDGRGRLRRRRRPVPLRQRAGHSNPLRTAP